MFTECAAHWIKKVEKFECKGERAIADLSKYIDGCEDVSTLF